MNRKKTALCPIEEGPLCVRNSNNARGQETPVGTNEASDGARPPRSAAASGRLVLAAPARRLSILGSLGWAGAAPNPQTGSSDGDTAIELPSEVVTLSVLVWFGRQRGMKGWVYAGHFLRRGERSALC